MPADKSRPKISIRGGWSASEDELLARLVEQAGSRDWNSHASALNRQTHGSDTGRTGKQCRERWHNHLRPDISTEPLTKDEQLLLASCHSRVGNKWSLISDSMPGRTENQIKNYVNATIRMREMMLRCKSEEDIETAMERCLRLRCSEFITYVLNLPDLGPADFGQGPSTIDGVAAQDIYIRRQRLARVLHRMTGEPRRLPQKQSRMPSKAEDHTGLQSLSLLTRTLSGSVKRTRAGSDGIDSQMSELEAPRNVTLDSMLAGADSSMHKAPAPPRRSRRKALRDAQMSTLPVYGSSGAEASAGNPRRLATRHLHMSSSSEQEFAGGGEYQLHGSMPSQKVREWEQTNSEPHGHLLRGMFHGRQTRVPPQFSGSHDKLSAASAPPEPVDGYAALISRSSSANNMKSWPRSTYDGLHRSLHGTREPQLESLPEIEMPTRRLQQRDTIDDMLGSGLGESNDGIASMLSERSTATAVHLRRSNSQRGGYHGPLRTGLHTHARPDPCEALLGMEGIDSPRSEAGATFDQLTDDGWGAPFDPQRTAPLTYRGGADGSQMRSAHSTFYDSSQFMSFPNSDAGASLRFDSLCMGTREGPPRLAEPLFTSIPEATWRASAADQESARYGRQTLDYAAMAGGVAAQQPGRQLQPNAFAGIDQVGLLPANLWPMSNDSLGLSHVKEETTDPRPISSRDPFAEATSWPISAGVNQVASGDLWMECSDIHAGSPVKSLPFKEGSPPWDSLLEALNQLDHI